MLKDPIIHRVPRRETRPCDEPGSGRRPRRPRTRRGITTIWGLASIGLLLTVAAVVVDGAMLYGAHADLQNAADSAALAGGRVMAVDPDYARQLAVEYGAKNTAAGSPVAIASEDVEIGRWDKDMRTFTPVAPSEEHLADAIQVTAGLTEDSGNPLRMAFAQVFGEGEADVVARATAVYKPRDIVVVLDLSGSMNYDSQIRHIPFLGQAAVEANLQQIWTELGANTYGNMGFTPTYIFYTEMWYVRAILGLDGVPYPYPSGSWDDYILYVQRDNAIINNGYQNRYGGLTFVNYLLDRQRSASQTPDLWQVSAQPLTAVKNAVDLFLDYVEVAATEDRIGLAIYTGPGGAGLLEHALTDDMDALRTITWQRQAGHYTGSTNIGGGIETGRLELDANGHQGAQKTLVLLTDGVSSALGAPAPCEPRAPAFLRLRRAPHA